MLFEVLVTARAHVCEIDGRVQRVFFWVLLEVTVRASCNQFGTERVHVCEIDGTVPGGMQFSVLVQVLLLGWCCLRCEIVGGAGVQSSACYSLSRVYAAVILCFFWGEGTQTTGTHQLVRLLY